MNDKHIHETLPAVPTGWTKHLSVHLNFGSKGGGAVYSIKDDQGRATHIAYQYDTRKHGGAPTGFHVPAVDSDVYPSWAALCAAWPGILAKLKEKQL